MGDALVLVTIPEEAWMTPMDEGRPEATVEVGRRRTITWRIDAGDVWEPPREPVEQYGLEWYKNSTARRAHRKAVQESLESFLNERLARLYHMLRTGWWVLGKTRVRVVECRAVPEHEMRALVRAVRGSAKARRQPRIRKAKANGEQ